MSRKDFQLIAKLLGQTLFNCRADDGEIEDAIYNACQMLRRTNPLFDETKFEEAVREKI